MKNSENTKQEEKLPEGWKSVRLGEVLANEHLKVGIKNKNIYIPVAIGELGLRDRTEIYGEDKVLSENTEKYLIFPYSSVCFGLGSKSLAVDVNDVLDSKYSVSPAYKIFKFDGKKYNPSFFRKYFKFLKDSIGDKFLVLSARQGKKIDEEILLNHSVSLPPLHEQQKIAEILETVDRAIEKTDKIIEKYKRIKQGLMQDLLTKGIDENGKIRSEKTHKFKNSPLGRIPEEWEVVRLGEITSLRRSKCLPPLNEKYIGLENIEKETGSINGFIPSEEIKGISNEFRKGDVLFGKLRPNLRKFYFADFDGFCSTEIFVIVSDSNIINQSFLYLVIQSEKFLRLAESKVFGTKMPRTSWNILEKYEFSLPPLPEQQRIAEILSQIDNTIEKEEAYKQKLDRIKKGLMEDLLTGRVRVNKLIKKE